MTESARKSLAGLALSAVAVAVLAATLLIFRTLRHQRTSPQDKRTAGQSIEKRIETMLTAAQKGDVETFLACFADPYLTRLKQQADADFAERLRRSEATLQGFSRIGKEVGRHPGEVIVTIEKVYPEHEERYRLTLQQVGGDWKITHMQGLQKQAPRIQFGTPVYPSVKTR